MEEQHKRKINIKILSNFILPICVYVDGNIQSKAKVGKNDIYEFYGEVNTTKIVIRNLIQSESFVVLCPSFSIERGNVNYLKVLSFVVLWIVIVFSLVQNNFLKLGFSLLIVSISLLDFNTFIVKDCEGHIIENDTKKNKIKSIWELIKNGV
jgi:hypothetical protein